MPHVMRSLLVAFFATVTVPAGASPWRLGIMKPLLHPPRQLPFVTLHANGIAVATGSQMLADAA